MVVKNKYWNINEIVLLVVLGMVFGFISWILSQIWLVLAVASGPLADLMENILAGGWLLAGTVGVAILRRPYAGILAQLFSGFIQVVFFGYFVGPALLIGCFLQGLGSELPFVLSKYKKFSLLPYLFSGAIAALLVFFYGAFKSGWYGTDIFWLRLFLQTISGIIIGGLLGKVIVDSLYKTGVLDNYSIAKKGNISYE